MNVFECLGFFIAEAVSDTTACEAGGCEEAEKFGDEGVRGRHRLVFYRGARSAGCGGSDGFEEAFRLGRSEIWEWSEILVGEAEFWRRRERFGGALWACEVGAGGGAEGAFAVFCGVDGRHFGSGVEGLFQSVFAEECFEFFEASF